MRRGCRRRGRGHWRRRRVHRSRQGGSLLHLHRAEGLWVCSSVCMLGGEGCTCTHTDAATCTHVFDSRMRSFKEKKKKKTHLLDGIPVSLNEHERPRLVDGHTVCAGPDLRLTAASLHSRRLSLNEFTQGGWARHSRAKNSAKTPTNTSPGKETLRRRRRKLRSVP